MSPAHIFLHSLSLLLAFLLSLYLSLPSTPPSPIEPPKDPSYNPLPKSPCPNPPFLRPRPFNPHPTCFSFLSATPTSLTLRLFLPNSSSTHTLLVISTNCKHHAPQSISISTHNSVELNLSNLTADTDYTLDLRAGGKSGALECRGVYTTPVGGGNMIRNPSFEDVADSLYIASSFRSAVNGMPRHWTSFYNGRARRVCGVVNGGNGEFVAPRTGRCMLALGGEGMFEGDLIGVFHGTHQGIWIGEKGHYVIGAWVRGVGVEFGKEGESQRDRFAMVVGGGGDDGVLVDMEEMGKEWKWICVVVERGTVGEDGFLHVFFHLHDVVQGTVLVDDVVVRKVGDEEVVEGCYTDPIGRREKMADRGEEGNGERLHLIADVKADEKELTLAVPLTADRVLRLEALSRLYGGGPLVAAVAVADQGEVQMFRKVWEGKAWLRRHASVTFVRRSEGGGALAINALRNVAVRAVTSEFVLMVDVDMTPATKAFACLRDASWLDTLLPKGEKRILAPPVFIGDVQHRPARDKAELMNLLVRKAGTSYCLNSQRPVKVKRWYSECDLIETRFLTDYEPYGIVRRDQYPEYDERFSGYGFNKISWAYGAELAGWRIFVLPEAFLTHLNHVENDWVQSIDVPHYLQTWRRFLAFAVERGGSQGVGNPTLSPCQTP